MPTHKSAWKRMRQNERRRVINKAHRTHVRKAIKAFRSLDAGEAAQAQYSNISSVVDKAAKKGIIHNRTAARLRSRLSRRTRSA
jgi:small subunit ribosomal protein S20